MAAPGVLAAPCLWHRYVHVYVRACVCLENLCSYGVASISRLLKMIGLFYKRALQKRLYSAKETNFKEPTNRSHPVAPYEVALICRLLKIIGLFCKRAL